MAAHIRCGLRAFFEVKAPLPLPEARPIDVAEFKKALADAFGPLGRHEAQTRPKLGLAVSGGADSMALAALCSRLRHLPGEQGQDGQDDGMPDLQAFVVDHAVREGSNVEANSVVKLLAERGIPAQVLKVDWTKVTLPNELLNFEMRARQMRYLSLGKACRDLGITSLLLAHHEDDQAETVLMRLMSHHRTVGLTGMKPDSGIPDCRDIYGVYESGGLAEPTISYPNTLLSKLSFPPQLSTETGGIKLYRPMLSFPKSRLIATCQAEKMEWFEDPTNKDPTYTQRNAIRHIYDSNKMPAALSKPSILQLAKITNDLFVKLQEIRDLYLSRCQISDFQTRSGMMKIRFPALDFPTDVPLDQKEMIAAQMIRHVIFLISPVDRIPLKSMATAIKRMFPEFYPDEDIKNESQFTLASTLIQVHPRESPTERPCYTISRCPVARNEKIRRYFRLPETQLTSESLGTSEPREQTQEIPWSQWLLFDGRYWVRIKSKTSHQVEVRHFRQDDLQDFTANLSPASKEKLSELSCIVAGKLKWTLPCLVVKPENGEEEVIALPSFGIGIQDVENYIDYEIRYKKIYWGALSTERVDLSETPLPSKAPIRYNNSKRFSKEIVEAPPKKLTIRKYTMASSKSLLDAFPDRRMPPQKPLSHLVRRVVLEKPLVRSAYRDGSVDRYKREEVPTIRKILRNPKIRNVHSDLPNERPSNVAAEPMPETTFQRLTKKKMSMEGKVVSQEYVPVILPILDSGEKKVE